MEDIAGAFPAMGDALSIVFAPERLIFLIAGVVLGLCIGVFPGLGGIAGLSLLLPFVDQLDGYSALFLAVGLIAVIPTSDTFSSVLLGIPGSSASQATVLDGFPLAKRGQAARALSAAFASSLFGGVVGAIFLTGFIVFARPIVLAFGIPELLAIALLGLSMVAILSGRIPLKGVAAAMLGMGVGTIGESDIGGGYRMVEPGTPLLSDGLPLIIVGLGIFAVPEIISLLRQDRAIAKDAKLGSGWLQGVVDWWTHKYLSFRSAVIGVFVGVIPGLGGSVVDWITYGAAVQTTKDKSNFGSGEIRGVIAPESANNAKEGGGLVPTLLFGIPGSGSMAIFIVILATINFGGTTIEAGPSMVRDNLDITYSIVWSLALANIFGAGLCILLAGVIARLTKVPFVLLAPFLFLIISFAAFQASGSIWALFALAAIGVIGIMMRRFDWSRPAFLIGFVLSNPVENYLAQFAQSAPIRFSRSVEEGYAYVFSPIVIALLVIIVVSVIIGIRQGKKIHLEGSLNGVSKVAPAIFLLGVAHYFAFMLIDAIGKAPIFEPFTQSGRLKLQVRDMVLPTVIGAVGLLACLIIGLQMALLPKTHAMFADREVGGDDASAPRSLGGTLAWFAGLLGLTMLYGFIIALVIFLPLFFLIRARQKPIWALVYSAAGVGVILFLGYMLNKDYPPGILQELLRLPWPFR